MEQERLKTAQNVIQSQFIIAYVCHFHQFQHVPKNALVIEVGPHGLLQSLVKKTVGPDVATVSLMKKNEKDSVSFLLDAIGKYVL